MNRFAQRFVPMPVDSIGAPFSIDTSCAILDQLRRRSMLHLLHQSPTIISIGEASRLVGTDSDTLKQTLGDATFDLLVQGETALFNLSSVHGASSLVPISTSGGGGGFGGAAAPEDKLHRVFHRSRWHVAGQQVTDGAAAAAAQPEIRQDIWRRRESASSVAAATASSTASAPSGKVTAPTPAKAAWYSHPKTVAELDALVARHEYPCRLWVTPNQLPRTISTNGKRLQCRFWILKTLVPGAAILPRVSYDVARSYQFRPMHFWARTGLKVVTSFKNDYDEALAKSSGVATPLVALGTTSASPAAAAAASPSTARASATVTATAVPGDEQQQQQLLVMQEHEKEQQRLTELALAQRRTEREAFARMTQSCDFFAWFSRLDLKLFGLVPRPGESEPAAHFVENRHVAVVPLDVAYLSDATMHQLSAVLPQQPPAKDERYLRLLRADLKWSMIPSSRVEVPRHSADDARLVLSAPVIERGVFDALGIRPDCTPLVITVRIPQAAWNVLQVELKGSSAGGGLARYATGGAAQALSASPPAAPSAATTLDEMPPWYQVAKKVQLQQDEQQ